MKSLLKVHIKFILRNKCMIFSTYLLISILEFIYAIFFIILWNVVRNSKEKNKIKGFKMREDYLFYNKSFDRIKQILPQTILLVNNKTDYDSLSKFILNEIGSTVNCYMNKKDINQEYSLLIELINKNGKYRFKLYGNGISTFLNLYSEDFQKSTDLFYIQTVYKDYYNSDYNNRNYFSFLELQSLFSKYLIYKEKQMIPNIDLKINLGVNSYPDYSNYFIYNDRSFTRYLLFSFSFLLSLYTYFFNFEMINEKENKLANFLERKGISKKLYFISFFLIYLIVLTIPIIKIIIITFISIFLPRFYLLFLLNIILFIFDLFSVLLVFYILIPNKKYGFIIIKVFNLISPILGIVICFYSNSKVANVIFSFIPQINFIICTHAIIKLDLFPQASWEKIWLKANKMSYMESIIMYIIDFIFYFIIIIFSILYQESKLYFISFLKSFKQIFTKNKNAEKINNSNLNHLKIENITKTFEKINSVNNFNLDLYSNEIFCLLGENGSGKSTLLNIISGSIKPDEGDIIYNGESLIKNKLYNNQKINFVQQENLYYDYLTVKEHLELFSTINNKIVDMTKIEDLIKKINLNEKINCLLYYLSEGEKRKLNIALSLLDDSKIILLDDPTNNIDNTSKLEIWNLIKENKKDKIILLTTHSFYEAKYLGDKIGIIYNGNLVCHGTDSDLSDKNNIYINLFMKSNNIPTRYKMEEIVDMIKENINLKSDLEIKEINSQLFSIIIKSDVIKKDEEFENQEKIIYKILEYVKEKMEDFGIEDYTIASVSLENYFEKLNKNNKIFEEESIEEKIEKKDKEANFWNQMKLQLKRILLITCRNKTIYLIEFLSILFCTYSFIFIIKNVISNYYRRNLNILSILEENPIYIYENENNYLKNSYAYDLSKSITFKRIKERPTQIEHFIYLTEQNSWANIAKGSISINGRKEEDGAKFLDVHNTFIFNELNGYLFANTFLIVSSFLKNEYNIEASIFSEMEEKEEENDIILEKEQINNVICILTYFFGLLLFFSGIIYDRVKERKSGIKNFLYLNGINKWSYWISFFIVDYTKLIIISLLLIFPIYSINKIITNYFLANIFSTNLSLLIFIYFISSFFSKEDSGTKFLFLFALITISFVNLKIVYEIDYNFSIFYLTPISFMIFSFWRILKFAPNKSNDYIIQFSNIIFYGGLLILLESGYFNKFIQCLKCKKNKKELNKSHRRISSEKNNYLIIVKKQNINNEIINSNDNFIESKSIKIHNPKNDINQKTIEIEGLLKIFNFGCCRRKVNCLEIKEDISLAYNEKLGIIGNNGSGRTMIFKSIINEISYDKGTIHLFGYDSRKDFGKIKSKIGYCPQINIEFDSMKVKEIIQFFLDLKSQKITAKFLCQKFCLQNYLDIDYNNLSFGNKRKLFLLISLINYPELLLLDNPFNSVDDISKKIIIKYLNKLFEDNSYNCNILMSTNSLEEINKLCDKKIFLNYEKDNNAKSDFENREIYKLLIKFNDSFISNEEISNQKIQETLTKISIIVEGFDDYKNYFLDNVRLEPYLNKLVDIINKIIENINYIKLNKIGKDLSFEFNIEFIQKRIVYTKLINIAKNKSNLISEFKVLNINKLNILT